MIQLCLLLFSFFLSFLLQPLRSVSAKDVDVHGELAAAGERLEQAQVGPAQRVVVDELLPPAAELAHLAPGSYLHFLG